MTRLPAGLCLVASLVCVLACEHPTAENAIAAREGSLPDVGPGQPIPGLDAGNQAAFALGQSAFSVQFSDADGVGPLFTDRSCGGCHTAGGKGPGFVDKMAVVAADGSFADPASFFPFGQTVHPNVAGGGRTPVVPPAGIAAPAQLLVSRRFGPPLFGRGYIEAVADTEILRMVQEQLGRDDGIRGRANVLPYASAPTAPTPFNRAVPGQLVIGRFGLKARLGTLDEFSADAFQNDMGLTTPLRPTEIANPDGLTDDGHPGVDLNDTAATDFAQFARLLAIPSRKDQDNGGAALFAAAKCAVCHAPALHTATDYPVAALRDRDAPIFSDLLVHDMGVGLADGIVEGNADGRAWRTAPLIGLRFLPNFLHDGRATTVEAAIAAHASPGSEANGSVALFDALDPAARAQLLAYVRGL